MSPVPEFASPSRSYDQLDRKEARLRPDQSDHLSVQMRKLNRGRAGQGERITDNTLIRVAIDLLLSRADELRGTTEDDLRLSLGLPSRRR